MRKSFEHELPEDVHITVRRCYGDDDTQQVVELTLETLKGGWFSSCVLLSPTQAVLLSRDLLAEAMMPLVKDGNSYV